MKKRALYLLLTAFIGVLSSFRTIDADTKIDDKSFTEIGFQKDGSYYYTFYTDLTKEAPHPIAYIQVQNGTTGEVLKLSDFRGKVIYYRGAQFTIKDTARVSFYDGDKLISKELTGVIEGGVKP